jgi:Na+/H+-dicarboxylate symporter
LRPFFFEAVAETMVVIVHWVLLAAPFGVFALALGVGLRAGLGVAGTLAHYVAIVCLSQIGLILITYVVAVIWGRISLARFARAVAPAQVVAVSTQSSLASLPVMIERARDWRVEGRGFVFGHDVRPCRKVQKYKV